MNGLHSIDQTLFQSRNSPYDSIAAVPLREKDKEPKRKKRRKQRLFVENFFPSFQYCKKAKTVQ